MKPTLLATVIDSHTGGEPTRVVTEGLPDLGTGTVADQLKRFRSEHDRFRRAVVREPRGSDVLVGAALCPPSIEGCVAGVIFFNNVGYLGMCGHGMVGVVTTLAHLNWITPGFHQIETPVGVVTVELSTDGMVSVTNVPSHRQAKQVQAVCANGRKVSGDVAWSGNWFYLVSDHGESLDFGRVEPLTTLAWDIRQAINEQGFPQVDHVELFGPAQTPGAHARNFVLCPGKAYDRSPCGTGTSAKLACLAADGKLNEGEEWIQESIIGSQFTAQFRWVDRSRGIIEPTIRGIAFLTGESRLWCDLQDPFTWGIGAD